ncbi:MAG: serine/threonine-protein phosphatase [Thermoanaerobaculia bacterium]|nr:serine/threonine-protein phosphatase [Thermoanaerobaculia bacterium]
MHPILGKRGRLLAYLALFGPAGLLLAAVVQQNDVRWPVALALAVPLTVVLGFLCLAAWFPAQSAPLDRTHLWQSITSHFIGALLTSSLWQLAAGGWAWLLSRTNALRDAQELLAHVPALFFAVGVVVYLQAAAAAYVYLAVRTSHDAEKQVMEAQRRQELALQELEIARGLQHRLLPAPDHRGDRFRLTARNLAARGVAGDFYDYFSLPDGSLRIAVADVAGKGVAASLIMAAVKAVLPLVAVDRSVTETLGDLNRRLAGFLDRREFVALALAAVDPEGRVELANAGLPDPYVLGPGGEIRSLVAPQPRLPLGLRSELSYGIVTARLEPGERLLLLTDGLPEAPASEGEPLGYEALEEVVRRTEVDPSRPWLDGLFEELREATQEELEDDWTALLLERR